MWWIFQIWLEKYGHLKTIRLVVHKSQEARAESTCDLCMDMENYEMFECIKNAWSWLTCLGIREWQNSHCYLLILHVLGFKLPKTAETGGGVGIPQKFISCGDWPEKYGNKHTTCKRTVPYESTKRLPFCGEIAEKQTRPPYTCCESMSTVVLLK